MSYMELSREDQQNFERLLQVISRYPEFYDQVLMSTETFKKSLPEPVHPVFDEIFYESEDHPKEVALAQIEECLLYFSMSEKQQRNLKALISLCKDKDIQEKLIAKSQNPNLKLIVEEQFALKYVLNVEKVKNDREDLYPKRDYSTYEGIATAVMNTHLGMFVRNTLGYKDGIVPEEQKKHALISWVRHVTLNSDEEIVGITRLASQIRDHVHNGTIDKFDQEQVVPYLSNIDLTNNMQFGFDPNDSKSPYQKTE